MSVLIQYYRPKLYCKHEGGTPAMVEVKDEPERINLQSAKHLHEVMDNDTRFPELTKETMREFLHDVFVLHDSPTYVGYVPNGGKGFYSNEYFENQVNGMLNAIWRHWREKLKTDMKTPEFQDGDSPMRSLRDIGEDGLISPFGDTNEVMETLMEN
jgi:hypothetical protein